MMKKQTLHMNKQARSAANSRNVGKVAGWGDYRQGESTIELRIGENVLFWEAMKGVGTERESANCSFLIEWRVGSHPFTPRCPACGGGEYLSIRPVHIVGRDIATKQTWLRIAQGLLLTGWDLGRNHTDSYKRGNGKNLGTQLNLAMHVAALS
ncbi:uncharacterized protein EI90DRAFT_1680749 [Cantharellus anzutake]|uniref:uncharacterized protein n=1 Tax=Cantharellus anzutake TaxID=1750568 RepID=UPI0019054E09|nr:uncharacterized protein EI90DRAFT_1680749 [Cantharellus anzutake]KAF8327762.1 hypothetical protein EI90DRAFT_1680749 [Cantharellus anzutake]